MDETNKTKELDYAKDLWTAENVVARFAISQGILFMSNIGQKNSDLYCEIHREPEITFLRGR